MSLVWGRNRFVVVASFACWVVGVLVLLGWATDSRPLMSIFPGLVAMNPLTAICFGLAGLSLWLFPSRARKLGVALAIGVVALGAIRLGGYMFGLGWTPCQILFAEKLVRETPPNRMAPNTAAAFAAIGIALILLYFGTKRIALLISQLMGLAVGLLGLSTVIAYASNDLKFVSVFAEIPMALHTGAMFGLLGFGVLLARPDAGIVAIFNGSSGNATAARKLLAASTAIVMLSSVLRIVGQRAGLYGADFGSAAFAIVTTLCLAVVIGMGSARQSRSDAARATAEDEINRHAEFIRELIDAIPGFVFAKDEQGRFIL